MGFKVPVNSGSGIDASSVAASNVSETHIALLRGINVGGKNKLPMADLVELFCQAGCHNVRSYIQSGNILFDASPLVVQAVSMKVSKSINDRFGYTVPVIVVSRDELELAVRDNPFLRKRIKADPSSLHLAVLQKEPSVAELGLLDPQRSPADTFAIRDRHIYLYCPNGLARTKLTNAYFDRTLKTTTTIRNWRTVNKLLELT